MTISTVPTILITTVSKKCSKTSLLLLAQRQAGGRGHTTLYGTVLTVRELLYQPKKAQ